MTSDGKLTGPVSRHLPALALLLTLAVSGGCSGGTDPSDPATAVGLPALPRETADVRRTRCSACHGAGLHPEWAVDPKTITKVTVIHDDGGGFTGPGARKAVTYLLDSAKRDVAIQGTPPPQGIGSFRAKSAQNSEARVTPAQWSTIVDIVAESGLFRFEGEAAVSFAIHQEMAFVVVERKDRSECSLGSMHFLTETSHPTFAGIVRALDEVEGQLDWAK